jgi:rhomboid protease GluP
MPEQGLVAVYRSYWRPHCAERAFVLHAVGVESHVAPDGAGWALLVQAADAAAAAAQIRRYDLENPPRPRPVGAEPTEHGAGYGALAYACVVLLVAYLAGRGALGADWLQAGALSGRAIHGGEPWRALTALTLHLDVAHLLSNLGFGVVFGLLAGQILGPGVAWLTILTAAAAANLVDAATAPATHVSVGASTAVFATLGLLAAYEWRRRAGAPERRARRWAPVVAGVFLLAFTGTGEGNTDVLAHLAGFATGALAGIVHAARRWPRGPRVQLWAGTVALSAIVGAWVIALAVS